MMKYKEIRILGVIVVILLAASYELITAIMQGDKRTLIFSLLILFSALYITIGRYNNKIKEDYMIIYEFRLIGILPSIVEFKDIKSIQATKHIVTIEHKRISKVYMVDAMAFVKEYEEKTAQE